MFDSIWCNSLQDASLRSMLCCAEYWYCVFGMLRLDPEPVVLILTTTQIQGRFYRTTTEAARLLGSVVPWLVRASTDDLGAS